MASLLLEQQEKLRRHVDEWRFRCRAAVAEIGPRSASTSVSSASVRLRVAPTDPGVGVGAASLLTAAAAAEDNVDVSKFVAVLSHSCLEISRLSDAASSNLYRQLLLFGHTAEGPNEALLEGEPQKTFAHSIPLLLEVYEIINGLVMILGNLLRQLDAICSVHEILRHNGNTRSYLSLFSRMLDKVKSEVDVFSMSFEDVDFLDQVVHNLQKLFDIGFFQRLVQEDSPLCSSITLVRSNKKLLDTFYSFFSESSSEIIQRIGSLKELPIDRRTILHLLGLFLFFTTTTGEAPDKKSMNLLVEIFQLVPVVYVEGGKRIVLSDLIRFHCSPSLSLLPPIKEACEAFGIMKNSYLARLNEMHSRDIQAINDSLSCWSVSFQSAIHPSSQMLTEEWVRHLQKQILQGVVLADRIHMLVLSMLDLHMHLEVPLRREKAKSLCQMIVSLKAIGDLFHMKGSSLVRSLPHIINIIQSDIEQLIISLKTKLQNEIAKGSQAVKTGFLSSLIRGGTDTETRLIDSLSLVLMSLQLLEGGGSSQRQLTLSITMDILHSLGYLDIELVGVRKLISKFSILSNFWSLIDERTNCSFLYWRKEMLVTWLSMVYGDACKLSWLQNIIDAFSDGMSLLTLGNVGTVTLQHYEEEIENALRKEVVAPLCRDIETDLRLHVHSTHLKGSVFVNPTKTGVRNLSWYLRMKPLRLPSKFVDIKFLVENHLNSAFYTYSVMSNYDNRMYAEMHQLGELKYGVELEDFHLTVDTADQDFDLKQSMENLDSFSEAYSYNIVKQMFIENDLGGQGRKNLRVLCVDHIASSAAIYVRKPKFDLRYTTSCKLLGWDDDIVEISKVLDMGTRNNDPSDDRIQPFSILATNFSKKLQSNKLHEMKDFFQIVPSVIAHMMECRLLLKDKLLRRGHEDKRYTHTYDGFLLGVAFVLKVLEQDNSFDELNWFASTKAKLEGEAKDRDDKKTDRNTSGASFVSLKLWRSSPPVRTEQQKGGVDKGTRYMQEIELIECLFRLARTVLR
uniref:WASH complex subunit 4 N-terminal domain-containing protein n=1 Tax=Oryza rufipogon TaxID=4529 RepID=A0A0E0PT70_ORYRU